jgi:hypothetical protein
MTGGVAFRAVFCMLPLLSGCASGRKEPPKPVAIVEVTEDPIPLAWSNVATPEDQERLARIDDAWKQALARARPRFRTLIKEQGPLLDPKAALARAAPTPGPYTCRVVKLGQRPVVRAFKPFNCYVDVEGDFLTMVKQSGTQRPSGRLWTDADAHMVFLGAMNSGGEALAYAADERRDVAGRLERIGPFQWRLVVPFPRDGATLDVYELIPIVQSQA